MNNTNRFLAVAASLACIFTSTHASTTQVVFTSASTHRNAEQTADAIVIYDISDLTNQTLGKLARQAPAFRNAPVDRKPDNTAALLLGGLAQACAHAGQVVGAQTIEQKQQGILNTISSILATTAAVVTEKQTANRTRTAHVISPELRKQLSDLIVKLQPTGCLHARTADDVAFEPLTQFTHEQERFAALEVIAAHPVLSAILLTWVFCAGYEYISQHLEEFSGVINQEAAASVQAWNTETNADSDPVITELPETELLETELSTTQPELQATTDADDDSDEDLVSVTATTTTTNNAGDEVSSVSTTTTTSITPGQALVMPAQNIVAYHRKRDGKISPQATQQITAMVTRNVLQSIGNFLAQA